MKKKNKNIRKKALTAVGAVVAAGLTPGFIAVSAAGATLQGPNVEVTAAEVVAIDGQAYSFDELYAMQQVDQSQRHKPASQSQSKPQSKPQQATRYGVPCPPGPQIRPAAMYGVRPHIPAVDVKQQATVDREEIQMSVLAYLMDYCALLIDADKRGIVITPDSDLTRELRLTEDELKDLKAEIEARYGVEVSHHRFKLIGQLNTLYLVSEYITNIKTLWD